MSVMVISTCLLSLCGVDLHWHFQIMKTLFLGPGGAE